MKPPAEKILVLDFGSQYTQLIARTARELGAYCEIHPHDISDSAVANFAPRGIILSGGPESALEKNAPRVSDSVLNSGAPILGVCYGMQALAAQLGGELRKSPRREYGPAVVSRKTESPLLDAAFAGEKTLPVWMSHGDEIVKVPPGFSVLAESEGIPAAMGSAEKLVFGLQFHPEVSHTRNGREILSHFARDICGMRCEWTAPNFAEAAVEDIRGRVGDEKVLLALSGGVDSAVRRRFCIGRLARTLFASWWTTG